MNKKDMIELISAEADISKAAAETALNTFTAAVKKTLSNGGEVALAGFGTWTTGARAAREGRNPRTGETIKISAATTVKFKAGKDFKETVNQ